MSVSWSRPSPATSLAAAGAGDHPLDAAGFGGFYDRTARPLWAYVSRTVGDPALADDLVQEAYLRLLRASFVPESEAHAKNYLYRIASNLMRDHFRRGRRQRAAGEVEIDEDPSSEVRGSPGASPSPEDAGRGVRLRHDLGRFLKTLDPRDRQLLWLAHVERASHREIAEALGVQEASVRVLVFRARRRLAKMLEAHDLGPEVLT